MEPRLPSTTAHPTATHGDYIKARLALLAEEKALIKLKDELARKRQQLPWEKVEKDYVFDGPNGPVRLSELFMEGKKDLFVYHFMFEEDWDAGCHGCSCWSDGYQGLLPHLEARANFVVIAKAPLEKLKMFAAKKGWTFRFVSSATSDFNADYGVQFTKEQVCTHSTSDLIQFIG